MQVMPAHYWLFWFLVDRQIFIHATVARVLFSFAVFFKRTRLAIFSLYLLSRLFALF
jgi:hypothetical protein